MKKRKRRQREKKNQTLKTMERKTINGPALIGFIRKFIMQPEKKNNLKIK